MRGIKLVFGLPFKDIPEIEDITDKLPKKQPWENIKKKFNVDGLWDGKTWVEGFRNPEDINCIIIHHSGSPEGTITSHAKFHANKWGGGIAYHIMIDNNKIYQTNNLLNMTYHAASYNTNTIGIEVNRDLTKADLTDTERNLLYSAILTVKSMLPITQIKAHYEVGNTTCPGTSIDKIRTDIEKIEMDLSLNESDKEIMARVFAIASRISSLYNTAVGETKYAPIARDYLLSLEQPMKEKGILK